MKNVSSFSETGDKASEIGAKQLAQLRVVFEYGRFVLLFLPSSDRASARVYARRRDAVHDSINLQRIVADSHQAGERRGLM